MHPVMSSAVLPFSLRKALRKLTQVVHDLTIESFPFNLPTTASLIPRAFVFGPKQQAESHSKDFGR